MTKEFFEKKKQRLLERKEELRKKVQAAQSMEELRGYQKQLDTVAEDLADIEEMIRSFDEGSKAPNNATVVNSGIKASFSMNNGAGTQARNEPENPLASFEYRSAFMAFAQHGTQIPADLQSKFNDRSAFTADSKSLKALVPITISDEVVNKVKKGIYGELYSKVTKTSYQGGLQIPLASLTAQFRWITESTTAAKQSGGKADEYISFKYNTLEIKVSQTLLASAVTLDAFEKLVEEEVTKGYFHAMDLSIVNGSGVGQPLGILNDTRLAGEDHVIEFTATEAQNWKKWNEKFLSRLPKAYRNGELVFASGTLDGLFRSMTDANNAPVYLAAFKDDEDDRIMRKPATEVEHDILPDFASCEDGEVFGFFWQPAEYVMNINKQFTARQYVDEDTDEVVNKFCAIADGKLKDVNGVILFKKKVN